MPVLKTKLESSEMANEMYCRDESAKLDKAGCQRLVKRVRCHLLILHSEIYSNGHVYTLAIC